MLEWYHLWVRDSAAISPAGLDGSGSKLNTEKMMSWSSSPSSLCHCPICFFRFVHLQMDGVFLGPWHSTLGKLAWEMKTSLPLVPHKAVAEISKIGNLLERWVIVTHGCQSEPTDGSTGGWISESLFFYLSISLCLFPSMFLCLSLSLYLSLSPSRSLSLSHSLVIYLSVCLSACLPACLPACLSISLSLSLYLSIYLSIHPSTYLSLSNSAKLPPKVELDRSKTKQVCETSITVAASVHKSEALLLSFLRLIVGL